MALSCSVVNAYVVMLLRWPLRLGCLQCRQAVNKFGETRLRRWSHSWDEYRNTARNKRGKYLMPDRRPAFLGIIFLKVGYPGSVRPYASFHELGNIHQTITGTLMPAVQELGMALPPDRYAHMRNAATVPTGCPPAVDGVVAYIIDYHSLELMALKASVPVPYLQGHHMWTFRSDVWNRWLEDNQNNLQAQPPTDAQVHRPLAGSELQRQLNKVARIRNEFEKIVAAVQAL